MASEFEAYEHVHKGAANRIIRMAEKSLSLEIFAVSADKITEFVSMLLGKAFLYFLVAVAIYLVNKGKPAEAFLAAIAPIVSVIYSTFRKSDDKSKNTKK